MVNVERLKNLRKRLIQKDIRTLLLRVHVASPIP